MMMNQTIGMKILTPLCRKVLLQLLQSALWEQTPQSEVFASMTAQDWEQVLLASRQQTVKALVCQGLTMLPEDLQPSDFLLIRWMAELGQVEQQSHQMNEALLSLITFLEDNGLRPVVLKGQGLARLYRFPLLRECGDIDLYFPEARQQQEAHRSLADRGIHPQHKPDGSWLYSWQGVPVEHHPHLTDLANPYAQDCLQELERQYPCVQVPLGMGTDAQIRVPSPMLSLLLQTIHILHHAIGWGIGLRQMVDMAVSCQSFQGQIDAHAFRDASSRLHLLRWNRLLYGFLVQSLALPQECLPYEERLHGGRALEKRIWRDGNFGLNSSLRQSSSSHPWQGKCRTAWSMLSHSGLGWRYAPLETFFTALSLAKGQCSSHRG